MCDINLNFLLLRIINIAYTAHGHKNKEYFEPIAFIMSGMPHCRQCLKLKRRRNNPPPFYRISIECISSS